jgi:putative transposase
MLRLGCGLVSDEQSRAFGAASRTKRFGQCAHAAGAGTIRGILQRAVGKDGASLAEPIPRVHAEAGASVEGVGGTWIGIRGGGLCWQGRFYSCPLDSTHLWAALRYAERNPVRAGLVETAEEWRWSSAAVHSDLTANDGLLELGQWQARWDGSSWPKYLREKDCEEETAAICQCTHTGRPLGTAEFVRAMETATQRCLTPLKRGRRKRTENDMQRSLAFDRDRRMSRGLFRLSPIFPGARVNP